MSELITAGLNLVFYGMGTVFVFLTVLVMVTMAMSALVRLSTRGSSPSDIQASEDPLLIAAVAAAVRKFRQSRN